MQCSKIEMLNHSKALFIRRIQVHLSQSQNLWANLLKIQNVRAIKSFAFEPHMLRVLKSLRRLLACTESKALSIYDQFPSIRSIDMMDTVGNNIEILMKNGVTSETIIENPFLLVMTKDILYRKLNIFKMLDMKGNTINDFVPLLEMKEHQLQQVCASMVNERDLVPGGNRIYYFSQKLNIEANIISKYCVKNANSLVAPFDIIDRKIQILLDYNIKPLSILKSLYALDRSENVFVSRLEKLMYMNRKDVKIWFFKCADDVFEKYVRKMKENRRQEIDKIEPTSSHKIEIENKLNELLKCDSEDAALIYYNQISHFDQIDSAKKNIEFLTSHGISMEILTENAAILTMSLDELQQQLHTLDGMGPRHIDDFVPLICTKNSELQKFKETLEEYEQHESRENPIYYFSDRLKVHPSVVSSYFAKNPSIFFRSPKMLNQKLDSLLAFGVEMNSILNSPLTFRMSLNRIERRLHELNSYSIEPISSWMLTCTTSQIQMMVQQQARQQDAQKKLLEGCINSIDYLAKELNWNEKTKEKMIKNCPALAKCNFLKIQKHLDFLLNETHFTKDDISSYPRVFTSNSVEKLRQRIIEMATVNYIPKRLYIICLERKRYLEIIKKHCECINDEHIWDNFRKIEKRIKEK